MPQGTISRLADAAKPQFDRESQRRHDYRGVQKTIGQLVCDIGPGWFGHQFCIHAFIVEIAILLSIDNCVGIGQTQYADAQSGLGLARLQAHDIAHGLASRWAS